MDISSEPPARLRVAILLSIAVHVCALLLLAFGSGQAPNSSSAIADDRKIFGVTTIIRRPPMSRPAAVPIPTAFVEPLSKTAPAVHVRLALPAFEKRLAAVPVANRSARSPHMNASRTAQLKMHASVQTREAPPTVWEPAARAKALTIPSQRIALVITPNPEPVPPTPSPSATPLPSPVPSATIRAVVIANPVSGLFSQNYPPALANPAIVESIRSRLGGHGRLRIDIDESGRATAIVFLGMVAQDAAQDVRAQLLGLTYVPADCNGLHCDGTLEINY